MHRFPFNGMFLAGFECSTHRRGDRKRLDLVAATRHDRLFDEDYALIQRHGMHAARDGFRWHLIEQHPGQYDWSSMRPVLAAARRRGIRVIWDLCHYGYPDWLDLWSPDFPERFAAYCYEAVRLIREVSGEIPLVCPVNEISFWAWIGGEEGKINPYAVERGGELKRQLIMAKLAGIAAAKAADPEVTIMSAEPLINIVRDSNDEEDVAAARGYHQAQFEATDLLLGRYGEELGGHAHAIDIVGVNFYPHNQWRIRGGFVPLGHHDYQPFSDLLTEIYVRYRKPLLVAETGAENSARPIWLSYISQEVHRAVDRGVPVLGICIYPITDYLGWDNERHCQTGLFSMADTTGRRSVYEPLAEELRRQQKSFIMRASGDVAPLAANVSHLSALSAPPHTSGPQPQDLRAAFPSK